jgi:hypothetical protein
MIDSQWVPAEQAGPANARYCIIATSSEWIFYAGGKRLAVDEAFTTSPATPWSGARD